MTIAWTTPRTWVTGETPAAGLFNTYARDNGDYLTGETAWTNATLVNGWVWYGAPFAVPAYRKIGDMVWLKGLVKSGTASSTIFTLPAGYRPVAEVACPNIANNNAFAIVTVQSTGVVASTGSNVWLSLDTTFFSTLA